MKNKKGNLGLLKIKRGALFALGFSFFFFPGYNEYLTFRLSYQPPQTRTVGPPPFPLYDYPVNGTNQPAPLLSAQSVVVMDRDSAVLIYGKNEKIKLLPASTVKIMTALVALNHYRLEDVLTVHRVNGEGQDMKLIEWEKISVENLLYGLLVTSANDAALILAQNFPGGEKNFVAAMNQKAKELNINDTYFANPTGLDSDEDGNLLPDYSYTTALDLARLAVWVMKNPIFAKMVAVPQITVRDISGQIEHRLFNINELLVNLPGTVGVKTGWTEVAGECLVGLTEREGHGVITVVLGSQDRFAETAQLVGWIYDNFRWDRLTPSIQEQ